MNGGICIKTEGFDEILNSPERFLLHRNVIAEIGLAFPASSPYPHSSPWPQVRPENGAELKRAEVI